MVTLSGQQLQFTELIQKMLGSGKVEIVAYIYSKFEIGSKEGPTLFD